MLLSLINSNSRYAMKQKFSLPLWSKILSVVVWVVMLFVCLLLGISYRTIGLIPVILVISLVVLPLLALLLYVPVYTLDYEDRVEVKLLSGRKKVFKKDECSFTKIDKDYFKSAIRTFGSYGFMGFVGYYWSRRTGNFQMCFKSTSDLVLVESGVGKKCIINLIF